MRRLLAIGFAAGLLAFPGCESGTEDPIEKELELARRDGSLVLVEFYTKNCTTCARFERIVLGDPEVRSELRDFRIVRVSAGKYRSVADRYGVERVPDIRILAPSGRVLFRNEGFLAADKLVAAVRSCQARE